MKDYIYKIIYNVLRQELAQLIWISMNLQQIFCTILFQTQCNIFETFRKFTACFCFFFNKQLVETLPRKLSPFCFLYKYHPVHFFMLHMQHFDKYALNLHRVFMFTIEIMMHINTNQTLILLHLQSMIILMLLIV